MPASLFRRLIDYEINRRQIRYEEAGVFEQLPHVDPLLLRYHNLVPHGHLGVTIGTDQSAGVGFDQPDIAFISLVAITTGEPDVVVNRGAVLYKAPNPG